MLTWAKITVFIEKFLWIIPSWSDLKRVYSKYVQFLQLFVMQYLESYQNWKKTLHMWEVPHWRGLFPPWHVFFTVRNTVNVFGQYGIMAKNISGPNAEKKLDYLQLEVLRSSCKSVETLSKATIKARIGYIEQNLGIICKKFRWFFFNWINFLWDRPVSRNWSIFIVSVIRRHPVHIK